MGRQVDGRTYEQLRTALVRLERTTLESSGAYFDAAHGVGLDGRFTLLTFVAIERRRATDRSQLALFDTTTAPEPGEARVTLAQLVRENLARRHVITLSMPRYLSLASPVARRLYRLLELARSEGNLAWRVPLARLKEVLPLNQQYPSHLQRVLQPAHDMLVECGVLRSASVRQQRREWYVDYVLGKRDSGAADSNGGHTGNRERS
jgi:plasmid replication initiation protein